jgi:hypothetical protein
LKPFGKRDDTEINAEKGYIEKKKIYPRICIPTFSVPWPSKIYPNGTFGVEIYHLATLILVSETYILAFGTK